MRDWLWYASLAIESVILALLVWRRELPWLCVWLAFDVLTGSLSVAMHIMHPAGGMYQIPWGLKQPGVIVTRILAARECWGRLSGRAWTGGAIFLSALIYESTYRNWPRSILDAEFAAIAITSATLAFIILRSLYAVKKLTVDPVSVEHGHVMLGYLLMLAFIYYVTPAYRDTIGIGTGIVASSAYSSWLFVFVRHKTHS